MCTNYKQQKFDFNSYLSRLKLTLSLEQITMAYFCYCSTSQYLCVPEQSDAETDRDVVERVEAHQAHQQILQDNLRRV